MTGLGIADALNHLINSVQLTGGSVDGLDVTLPDEAYRSFWCEVVSPQLLYSTGKPKTQSEDSLFYMGVKVWRKGAYDLSGFVQK